MRLVIKESYQDVSEWAAAYIAMRVAEHNKREKRPFVLGLPTGSTPIGTYKALIKLYKAGKFSAKNIITFNMDEYVGLPQDHPESYHSFMWNNFFSHIDIPKEQVHILDGNAKDLDAECVAYEAAIQAVGGIDLFMGGIGNDGHIAFNEPGSSLASRTRVMALTEDTILVNSRFFDNDVRKVPQRALTVGVATVMDAKEVLVLIAGANKARALRHTVEEGVNHMWTCSAIQLHPAATLVVDDPATLELKVGTQRFFLEMEKHNIDPTTAL